MFGIALRRVTPTSPGSSCPTTGSGTRCARTTRRRASPSCSRTTPPPDERPASPDRAPGGDPTSSSGPTGTSEARLRDQTDEGAQVLRREVVIGGGPWPDDDETMILNMGPEHPSTHGVLRIMLELDGETILRSKPASSATSTLGWRRPARSSPTCRAGTNVTRMDYLARCRTSSSTRLAVERLLDLEVPPRAVVDADDARRADPRTASHLLFQATNGMDVGAVSMMLYGWRRRGDDAAPAREDHRFAHEPQLHPPRWPGCRSAPGLGGGHAGGVRSGRAGRAGVRRRCSPRTRSSGRAPRRRRLHQRRGGDRPRHHRADPALHRLPMGPAQGPAVPGLRRGRLRRRVRRRTATATTGS